MKRKKALRRALVVGETGMDRYNVMLSSGAMYAPLSLDSTAEVLDSHTHSKPPGRLFRKRWQYACWAPVITPAEFLSAVSEAEPGVRVVARLEW